MKRACLLLCCLLGFGCSAAADPAGTGRGGMLGGSGTAGQAQGGTSAGSATGGSATGGAGASGGSPSAGAPTGGGGTGGSSGGGNGGAAAGGGSGGGAGGATGGAPSCLPDPNGALSVVGETVHDAKTCLDWMKTTKTGVNYAAAEMYCGDANVGGFDDWRIPTASEYASTITLCGKYPPDGPNDTKFFDQQGDGYWTTTPAGEPNKVCAVGTLNAGGYYHYGTAGPQVVRCVRGSGTVKMVKDCTVAMGCKDW